MRSRVALSALLAVAGLALAPGIAAAQRRPSPACPDILLGDSLAVGMGPHAREAGFLVIAQTGAGIAWLREQRPPPCANRLVLMFGTNDLRAIDSEAAAEAYVRDIIAITDRWEADRIIWATPGCFDRDPALEAGSVILDRTLLRLRAAGLWAYRFLPALNRGRTERCRYESRDGVHPAGAGYQAWWSGIAARIGLRAAGRPTAIQARPMASTSLSQASRSLTPSASIHPSQRSASPIRVSEPGSRGKP
ncbi:MAG TPA: SGNH/GDSL hydrolase family protein [Roseomonas sp.]|jgi:hypothetical protein